MAEEDPKTDSKKESLSVPSIATTKSHGDDPQIAENYIEIYHAISEWIRFADAKAAVILTVGGALAGFLIPSFSSVVKSDVPHLIPYWNLIVTGLFVLYLVSFLWSAILAFLCINPIRERGKHPALDLCSHFHPAAIASKYSKDQIASFVENCNQLGPTGLRREIQAGILLDSHISNTKYRRVSQALRVFAVSSFFGFVYFLLAQF